MVKKVVTALILSIALFSCQNKNTFQIEGSFQNIADQKIYFNKMNVSSSEVLDSTQIDSRGNFSFKGTTEYPRFYQLELDNQLLTLLIRPNEQITLSNISDDLNDYQVEGSKGSENVQLLETRLQRTTQKLDSLKQLYQEVQTNTQDQTRLDEINKTYQKIAEQQRDSSISFILDHLGSPASIMALYQKLDEETFVLYKNQDLQYIKLVADSLQNKYPESEHVKSLIANKDRLMKRYRNLELTSQLSKMSDKMDNRLPDIRLPNPQGDTISLDQVDEKMVLVSFWASTNQASVKRNMELQKIYNQYHSKGFEIYQVSLDKIKGNWKKGLNFDQLPWISVHSAEGRTSYAARIYNVQQVPTDFLIKRGKEDELITRNPSAFELKRQLSIALD